MDKHTDKGQQERKKKKKKGNYRELRLRMFYIVTFEPFDRYLIF